MSDKTIYLVIEDIRSISTGKIYVFAGALVIGTDHAMYPFDNWSLFITEDYQAFYMHDKQVFEIGKL